MKPIFLLVQLSAFRLIEHFSREFGLDAIILLGRILPKAAKSGFRLTCVGLKTSLLCKLGFKMLKPFYQAFPALLNNIMQTVVSPLLFLTWSPTVNLRQGALIRGNPLHARRLHIPWFCFTFKYLPFNIFSDLHNSSTSDLHWLVTRQMRRQYSAMHFAC